MNKNILMLGAALALMVFGANAQTVQTSGTDGNITWSVENGVLTISGNGSMPNYDHANKSKKTGSTAPWYDLRDQITSVVVEQGVTSVGNYAFRDLNKADTISLPTTGLTYIGQTSFENTTSLTSMTIPDSVTTMGNWAFQTKPGQTSQLTSLTIGSGLTSIGESAFANSGNLTELTISSSVTSIGKNAFQNATKLETLVIPNNVTSLGEGAFQNASSLKYLTLSDNLGTIPVHAFENAVNLEVLKLPTKANGKILEGAFSHAEKLTTIDFGGVTEIGNKAFAYNYGLKELVIPDTVTTIGGNTFKDATSLTTLVIGNGVTSLGKEAFLGNTALKSLTIGTGLTSFGTDCFKNSPITELTIDPKSTHLDVIVGFFQSRSPAITKINCLGADRSACDAAMAAARWDISGIAGDGNVTMPAPTTLTAADVQPPVQEPTTEEPQGGSGDEVANNDSGEQGGNATPGDQVSAEPEIITNPAAGFDRNAPRFSNKIYTVQEANLAAGRKNRVMIRYR